MHQVNLAGIDLNLLTALEALLRERSVTRAAEAVGLSQPAMSRALGRLRALFDDRLFVRGVYGLIPTPRAMAVEEPLQRALAGLRGVLMSPGFDPARHQGRFRVLCPDVQCMELLPTLANRLQRTAPGVELEVISFRTDPLGTVEAGEADLSVGYHPQIRAGFHATKVYNSSFSCLVRADHPVVTEGLTLKRFVDMPHILVTVTGRGGGAVDTALATRGLSRQVAVRLPHFMAAPLVVAQTDMVLTVPSGLARRIAVLAPLAILPPPVELPGFDVRVVWHERFQDDPAHTWFRREVVSALREGAAVSD
ncbi:LysR family transcriptional regulator [Niveispirillum cyanobacteriorum]|uniref:LysR family transcriptional regulator n=1 Tax=Niveispirillum cyanobacteriorum TaxID=1612173 RepID=A0A2K9NBF8_9PROT|nr:LysR family transcriptional regulator [Niveispirillum cyanobacteriorum]AUN29515.1 LysR family transcriptional regulator [Niveispirillum cyanobacteriorum]GGE63657.1 LysR family transcriptional regulator [Niveispirillum cyanobacteriorum]